MKHIVIDAREWSTTTGRYVNSLVRYLHDLDHEHRYTILLYPKDMEKWQPTNPNFTTVACPHKEFTFDEQIGLKKQLEQLHPDLVHFGMVQQPVFYHASPVVTTMHDLTTIRFRNPTKNALAFTLKQMVYKWVNKRVARKSDAIITPTEFVKKDVVEYTGVSPDKITVTYEAADLMPAGSEPVAELEGTQFIMYLGRPLPHKNLGRLIDAYALLKQQHPGLKLVLAGKKDAMYRIHEERVQRDGIQDVVFTDFVTDQQLRWLYEHCAAYVFPALSEGFGLPALEAMLHGAPVASSNATCLPEVYGDAANYFDPTSVSDMARAIHEILVGPELRTSLVAKGTERAKSYSWERMAEQTLDVYKHALGE